MKTMSMKKKVLHRHLDWVKYYKLLFGVNEKLLTQHISGPIAKYNLLPATSWTRTRTGHLLLSKILRQFTPKTNQ